MSNIGFEEMLKIGVSIGLIYTLGMVVTYIIVVWVGDGKEVKRRGRKRPIKEYMKDILIPIVMLIVAMTLGYYLL